jgi:2'-5' RNA ligase
MRLFFALWPEPGTLAASLERLRALTHGSEGRPQRPDQLHLTLEFLGDVPEGRLAAVLEAGADASGNLQPFEVVLDRLEHWRRPQVLCLTAEVTPQPLAALVQSLRAGLAARSFHTEQRPFKAHLTLARKVRRPPADAVVEPLAWPAHEFSLVESTTDPAGSRYERLATWPIGV